MKGPHQGLLWLALPQNLYKRNKDETASKMALQSSSALSQTLSYCLSKTEC